MAATIKDVCRVTGLSQGTVSKYLNNKPVSQKNCEKIRAAIEELGYQVNSIARGLRTNSAHTIGILIPDMGNILSTAIIETVESMLTMQQYSSIICFHHSDRSHGRTSCWPTGTRSASPIRLPISKPCTTSLAPSSITPSASMSCAPIPPPRLETWGQRNGRKCCSGRKRSTRSLRTP